MAGGGGWFWPDRRFAGGAAGALSRMVGAVSWSWLPAEKRAEVTARLPLLAAAVNFRCAAAEWRLAASGGASSAVSSADAGDHLPGSLIHREAGGFSARFDGSPYLPGMTGGGLIAAPDRASWQEAKDALLGP